MWRDTHLHAPRTQLTGSSRLSIANVLTECADVEFGLRNTRIGPTLVIRNASKIRRIGIFPGKECAGATVASATCEPSLTEGPHGDTVKVLQQSEICIDSESMKKDTVYY